MHRNRGYGVRGSPESPSDCRPLLVTLCSLVAEYRRFGGTSWDSHGSVRLPLLIQFQKKLYNCIPSVLNLGCLHPVACVRSGDGVFYIRLRN
jgi:hypothetical protein